MWQGSAACLVCTLLARCWLLVHGQHPSCGARGSSLPITENCHHATPTAPTLPHVSLPVPVRLSEAASC